MRSLVFATMRKMNRIDRWIHAFTNQWMYSTYTEMDQIYTLLDKRMTWTNTPSVTYKWIDGRKHVQMNGCSI